MNPHILIKLTQLLGKRISERKYKEILELFNSKKMKNVKLIEIQRDEEDINKIYYQREDG